MVLIPLFYEENNNLVKYSLYLEATMLFLEKSRRSFCPIPLQPSLRLCFYVGLPVLHPSGQLKLFKMVSYHFVGESNKSLSRKGFHDSPERVMYKDVHHKLPRRDCPKTQYCYEISELRQTADIYIKSSLSACKK
jgi:hypothetical protein